jgi:hypothetical protein
MLLCHSAAESAPPHLDPYRHLLGGSDYPYPTALEAYSKEKKIDRETLHASVDCLGERQTW